MSGFAPPELLVTHCVATLTTGYFDITALARPWALIFGRSDDRSSSVTPLNRDPNAIQRRSLRQAAPRQRLGMRRGHASEDGFPSAWNWAVLVTDASRMERDGFRSVHAKTRTRCVTRLVVCDP